MARAMRVSELMTDYRNTQTYMASIRSNPSAEEYNEEGFQVLRHCVAESQRLLQQGFATIVPSATAKEGDEEAAKTQLRRVIYDAATKRFFAHKTYLQAQAAIKWCSYRQKILQLPNAQPQQQQQAVMQIRVTLRQELAALTDQRVEALLRYQDMQERKWIVEDPGLDQILRMGTGLS
ncbi:hypothetical protein Slin15195_G066940 [Septoria linicola]|uniref:Uncharacterized protein n=1 Tax=Septoria linicola TaxID=215465 RepID=A0A9Q9AQR2_9PEZI|nr:hypothetical protein Slin14017_G099650 [Septoria linicola]USW53375.1 hypothetical protein Slin15195_G066940 [Septoria linicola]